MPKRGAFALGLTALALVLLLNFQTPTEVTSIAGRQGGTGIGGGTTGNVSGGPSPSGSGSSGSRPSASRSPGPGSSGNTSPGTTGTRSITGPTVDTRWGPVQVSVTLTGRKLADITALQLPSGGRSSRISSYVEPILRSEALQAQSSQIDGVSGATFTSEAYAQSLQAALDSAGT